ncbi:proline-rich protein 2-like [Nyctibius grandis]|uniref:proline-rich protein 2-like n=1 Tax=Nyctibius grandis TaxID=48427 RepID=UPI0035BBFA79
MTAVQGLTQRRQVEGAGAWPPSRSLSFLPAIPEGSRGDPELPPTYPGRSPAPRRRARFSPRGAEHRLVPLPRRQPRPRRSEAGKWPGGPRAPGRAEGRGGGQPGAGCGAGLEQRASCAAGRAAQPRQTEEMESSIAVISTITPLLKIKRQVCETHRNTGLFPTKCPPPHHPELEVLPPPKLQGYLGGKRSRKPQIQSPEGLKFPVTFSISDSEHSAPAEHPSDLPRGSGLKTNWDEGREPRRSTLPAPVLPDPESFPGSRPGPTGTEPRPKDPV